MKIGWKHSLTILVFAIFGILAVGTGGSNSDSTNSAETAFSLSAGELYKEYNANEVAADAKYKGKTGEVTGTRWKRHSRSDVRGAGRILFGRGSMHVR